MGGIWGNKKVKEIFYPDWEGSMNTLGGFRKSRWMMLKGGECER